MTPAQVRKMTACLPFAEIGAGIEETQTLLYALANLYDEAQHWRHNMNKHGEADLQPLMDALRHMEALDL